MGNNQVSVSCFQPTMLESNMSEIKSLIEKLDVEGASKIMEGKSVEELSNLLLSYAYDESEGGHSTVYADGRTNLP